MANSTRMAPFVLSNVICVNLVRPRHHPRRLQQDNNEEIARSVFQKHPGMVLKEEHIAVFVANWDDKAANIRRIRETLNIGFDTMVFLDDNPLRKARTWFAKPFPKSSSPSCPKTRLSTSAPFRSLTYLRPPPNPLWTPVAPLFTGTSKSATPNPGSSELSRITSNP